MKPIGDGFVPSPLACAVDPDGIREHMFSAMGRGLRELTRAVPAHDGVLSIAASGPSLAETYGAMTGRIAALNGSHDYLIGKGVIPFWCAFVDPQEVVAHLFTPRDDVLYFVASMCHPAVFDKLKGHHVVLWHASWPDGTERGPLDRRDGEWLTVGGGSTIGLRWIALGYALGYRRFHLHGMDASYTDKAHAGDEHSIVSSYLFKGYRTSPQMASQVNEMFTMYEGRAGEIEIEVFGDGLLQSCWREYRTDRELLSMIG